MLSDFGSNDYGTWHRALCPEPGDPVTVYWMEYMAENTARLTKPLAWVRNISTPVGNSLQFELATMPCQSFPFAKSYIQLSGGWTDKYALGEGNSALGAGEVTSLDLRFISYGSAEATMGALDYLVGEVSVLPAAFIFWGK